LVGAAVVGTAVGNSVGTSVGKHNAHCDILPGLQTYPKENVTCCPDRRPTQCAFRALTRSLCRLVISWE
jgi:hypothetical protein